MKHYTEEEKKYICSQITSLKWDDISDSLKDFWLDYRERTKKKIPNFIYT